MIQPQTTSPGFRDRPVAQPNNASGALSARQLEVLVLLSDGVSAREIGIRLHLAEATVRNHIRAILRKLGCHSQLEAVATAVRLGLLRR